MIVQATLSRPAKNSEERLEKPYIKVRIWKKADSALLSPGAKTYEGEFFTQTQAFRKQLSQKEAEDFVNEHAGKTFRNALIRREDEEETILTNRHGKITSIKKPIKTSEDKISGEKKSPVPHNRKKNYLFEEGCPVPFLVELGVMTKEGKVVAQKYDKFRQINRFAEYINDLIPQMEKLRGKDNPFSEHSPLTLVDFGSGKSYLTFAAYHLLHEVKKIPCKVTGLDLKKDVIENCQKLSDKCGYTDLNFSVGDIADYGNQKGIDLVITLHACDTATDYALDFAIKNNVPVILSVPCCQHEINLQLEKLPALEKDNPLASIARYPLLRERLAALATDAVRAELLEQKGYSVQALEFIDMTHTPKNIMLRAVKTQASKNTEDGKVRLNSLLQSLGVSQTLYKLLED